MEFVFLVQAPSKLPSSYLHLREQGNVLLLSYQEASKETDVFFPRSTWTEGRNELYELALEKFPDVDFLVFMDYDLDLTPDKTEKFLEVVRQLRPDVSTPNLTWYKHEQSAGNSYLNLPPNLHKGVKNGRRMHIQTVDWFDAAFNCFSREAARKLLPYTTDYDQKSWHFSQLLLIFNANNLFRNCIYRVNFVKLKNLNHSQYPKNRGVGCQQIVKEHLGKQLFRSLRLSDLHEIPWERTEDLV